jgi:hypothetical protein
MGRFVRLNGLIVHVFGSLICLAVSCACAAAQSPVKEPSPFDWLRQDAAPVNRLPGPTVNAPVDGAAADKTLQSDGAIVGVTAPAASAVQTSEAPKEIVGAPLAAPPVVSVAQESKPVKAIARQPPSHPKAQHVFDRLDVTNNRAGVLNELKFVSIKNGGKSFSLKPSLKGGQSVRVEVPTELGCRFVVWVQVDDDPVEQHEGVDLCDDKKVFLIN